MNALVGGRIANLTRVQLEGMIGERRPVIVDIGAGDGKFAYRLAADRPDAFCIGIDANQDNLLKQSKRVRRKPTRGGKDNILYLVSRVQEITDELQSIADEVFVNLPWGELLHGIVVPKPELLSSIRRICMPGAPLRLSLYHQTAGAPTPLVLADLPELTPAYLDSVVMPGLEQSGFQVTDVCRVGSEEIRQIGTTWARKLAQNQLAEAVHIEATATRPLQRQTGDTPPSPSGKNLAGTHSASYTFKCSGHPNIRGTHHKTVEFTRDNEITGRATCVLGVAADFSLADLQNIVGNVTVEITVGDSSETFHATVNPAYGDSERMIFRKSRLPTEQTFAVDLDKPASQFTRSFIRSLSDPDASIMVTVKQI